MHTYIPAYPPLPPAPFPAIPAVGLVLENHLTMLKNDNVASKPSRNQELTNLKLFYPPPVGPEKETKRDLGCVREKEKKQGEG